MEMVKSVFAWLAIVLGLVSAYWWFKASVSRVTRENNTRYDLDKDVFVAPDASTEGIPLIATAQEQGRLNKIAASCTAASLICQAIASIIP